MSGIVTTTQYENYIIPEHQGQPDYTATIDLSVQPFVDGQNEIFTFTDLFDLDLAIGSQLDAVGVRVGRNRYVTTPLTSVFFSWDIAGLGWNQGFWQGEFNPTTGVTALDDNTYRLLLRAIIIANSWDGTIAGAAPALAELFNNTETPGSLIFIEDGLNMMMTIGISGTPPPIIFQALLSTGEIDLHPVGVGVNYALTSVSGTPIFGFDIENQYVSGADVGSWAIPLAI